MAYRIQDNSRTDAELRFAVGDQGKPEMVDTLKSSGVAPIDYAADVKSFIENRENLQSNSIKYVSLNDYVVRDAEFVSSEYLFPEGQSPWVKETLQANRLGLQASALNGAKYFAETANTLYRDNLAAEDGAKEPPEVFLIDPISREGTSRTAFGLAPCGGGSKGKSRFVAEPGEKTDVEWIIKHPVKGGRCQVKLSRGHGADPNSYEVLHVDGHGFDKSTGKFICGESGELIEEVQVQLPYDTSCPDCTLQWTYEAPGYGIIYQCSDISIVDAENREKCEGGCLNGGICQEGKCYCVAGYSGKNCQIAAPPSQTPEKQTIQNIQAEPAAPNKGGIGIIGWYFIWLLISLLLAGLILLLVYFLFWDKIKALFGYEVDEDEENRKYERKSRELREIRQSEATQQENEHRRRTEISNRGSEKSVKKGGEKSKPSSSDKKKTDGTKRGGSRGK